MERKQIIGLLLLLLVLGGVMLTVNLIAPYRAQDTQRQAPNWDSIKVARRDSAKAYWDSVKVARYDSAKAYWDSVRVVRRDSAKAYWDSVKVARRDSAKAYWDSVKTARKDSIRFVHPKAYSTKKDTLLDLNSADTTQLQYLRGIGPYVAKRIVMYRQSLGGYASVGQLREIEVLCRYDRDTNYVFKFDSVLPHLVVNKDSIHKMPINRMSAGALSKHPYLRFDQAKAVYELRRRKFNLKTMDELRPILGDSLCNKIEPYLDFSERQ